MSIILKGFSQHDHEAKDDPNYRPWVGVHADKPNGRLHTSQIEGAKQFRNKDEALDFVQKMVTEHPDDDRYLLHQMYEIQEVYFVRIDQGTGRRVMR